VMSTRYDVIISKSELYENSACRNC
jgi:hypothetical protein